jgi:hypothetical protein
MLRRFEMSIPANMYAFETTLNDDRVVGEESSRFHDRKIGKRSAIPESEEFMTRADRPRVREVSPIDDHDGIGGERRHHAVEIVCVFRRDMGVESRLLAPAASKVMTW